MEFVLVFILNASAEIWGFRYVLALGIGTIKIIASTVVFGRVVFLLSNPLLVVRRTRQA
jgi:hypothetical protein